MRTSASSGASASRARASENERLGEELEVFREELLKIDSEGHATVARRNEVFEKVSGIESELHALRQKQATLGDHRSRAEVQQTRVELKLENLTSQIQERYHLSLDAFEPDPHALLLTIAEQRKSRDRNLKRKATLSAKEDVASVRQSDVRIAGRRLTARRGHRRSE